MANLGIFEINTNGEYMNLSTLTGITFVTGNSYLIQNYGGSCIVIESSVQPTEGGFVVDNKPFKYECDGSDIYIQTNGNIYLNISE